MAPRNRGHSGKRANPVQTHPKSLKRKREEDNIEQLNQKVSELEANPTEKPELFSDLPFSSLTLSGLSKSHFKTLTAIQSRAIPSALKGNDILGAAKTGSGKTLTFLVPVLENLFRKKWTEYDGLGALILSPTRELAIQIFDVLRQVGRYHSFSAGLVIGGKPLQEERERLGRMNILVATPGRMLQHMDQTSELEIGNLQMLILDEADRIMDMGFQTTIDALIEHLPTERQTLLFSATQTKKVSDLGRLSLRDPEFISADEKSGAATPAGLQQNYVLTPLPQKLDTLWSFIRSNLKKKILVFLSSGKQVRYIYESLRHLQPGLPILHLHGRQKQTARLDITTRFSSSKHACLFATDVAARGLDFPAVDWVVQVDCPEDADTYIHRVGRTARYEHRGNAVMFLDPSEEEGMLKALEKKKISIEKINVRQKKMQNTIQNQLQNMCFKDSELKYLGQKCFTSYVRSVYVQKDKDIFKLKELDLEKYAASLGLPGTPYIKFARGEDAKIRKNAPRNLPTFPGDSDDDSQGPKSQAKPTVKTKYDRMFERTNQDVLTDHYKKMINNDPANGDDSGKENSEAEEEGDFLSVKRIFNAGDQNLGRATSPENQETTHRPSKPPPSNTHPPILTTKNQLKPQSTKKKLLKSHPPSSNSHLVFDATGANPQEIEFYEREEEFTKKGDPGMQRQAFLVEERERARLADVKDREVAREKKRVRKERRKAREKDGDEVAGGDENGNGDVEMDDGRGVHLASIPHDLDSEAGDASPIQRQSKRQKKWFEDPSSDDDEQAQRRKQKTGKKGKTPKRVGDGASEGLELREPRTVEDLETMAQSLLAR